MFETVFIYSDGLQHMMHLKMFLLFFSLIAPFLIYLIKKKRGKQRLDKIDITLIYYFSIPLCLLIFFLCFYIVQIYRYNFYKEVYLADRYKIAEGFVDAFFKQPYNGHAKGDRVVVNDVEFEVNYFSNNVYRKTISHDGFLRKGTYAKIYYYKDQILRIDIKK